MERIRPCWKGLGEGTCVEFEMTNHHGSLLWRMKGGGAAEVLIGRRTMAKMTGLPLDVNWSNAARGLGIVEARP